MVASRMPDCPRNFLACWWSVDFHQHACSPLGAEGTRCAGRRGDGASLTRAATRLGVALAIFQVLMLDWHRLVRLLQSHSW